MIRTFLLVLTWSAVLALSVGAALNSHRLLSRPGTAIASLVDASGIVQLRPDGTALWADAGRRQDFVEGDVVATGPRSTAQIAFAGGREIYLEEGSQVVISEKSGNEGRDVVVTLVKGSLRSAPARGPKSIAAVSTKLTIRSGGKGVELKAPTDAIAIKKDVGPSPPEVHVVSGSPAVTTLAAVRAQPLPAPAPLPAPPAPRDEPPPAADDAPEAAATVAPPQVPDTPKVEVNPLVPPRITEPPSGVTLWTSRSLRAGEAPPLSVSLSLAEGRPRGGAPAVKIYRDRKAAQTVPARATRGRYVATLSPALLRGAGHSRAPGDSDLSPLRLALRTSLEGDGASLGSAHEIRVASLADAPKGGVSVYLDSLAFADGSAWISQTHELERTKARYTLRLKSGANLARTARLLRGSGAFAIAEESMRTAAEATYIIRGDELVARLDAKANVTPDAIAGIRRLLGGTIAFRGKGHAFLGRTQPIEPIEPLFVLRPDWNVVSVRPGVLKRHPKAVGFARAIGTAVFSEAVSIADPVPPPSKTAAPDASAWSTAINGQPGAIGLPRKLVFIESASQGRPPVFLKMDAQAFSKLGVLEAVDAAPLQLTLKLNAQALAVTGDKAQLVRRLLDITGAEALVLAPKGAAKWQIVTVAAGRPKIIASTSPPGDQESPSSLHRWAMHALGVDGVVLDRRGDFLLAEVPAYFDLTTGKQGLVADGGALSAIVEATSTSGGRAVFRLLLEARSKVEIRRGAHVLLE